MRFGFHVPLGLNREQIDLLGEELLAPGHYDWIEIKYPYELEGYDPSPYLAGVEQLIKRYNPGVSLHLPTECDLGHPIRPVRREVIRVHGLAADFAAGMGAGILAVHPGTILTMDIPKGPDSPAHERLMEKAAAMKRRAWGLTVSALRELDQRVERRPGLMLAVENLILAQEVVYTAGQLAEMVDQVGGARTAALFDAAHAHRLGLDPAAYVTELGGRLIHVHLSDNDGSCDLHQIPGEGDLPFAEVLSALQASGYDGAVVLECPVTRSQPMIRAVGRLRRFLADEGCLEKSLQVA